MFVLDLSRDTACPGLAGKGIEVIRTNGGHHFDGDYRALAARILQGLKQRLATAPHQAAAARTDLMVTPK